MRRPDREAPRVGVARWRALLLLAGCGELPPGTASVVDGHHDHRGRGRRPRRRPVRRGRPGCRGRRRHGHGDSRVHQQSLGLLIDTEVSRQYAEEEESRAPEDLADGLFAQFERAHRRCRRSRAPCSRACSSDWADGRDMLVQAGRRGDRPAARARQRRAGAQRGLRGAGRWLEKGDIETDPRYPPARTAPRRGRRVGLEAGSDFAKDAGRGGARRRVGRAAAGQPEVRLTPWRADRSSRVRVDAERPRWSSSSRSWRGCAPSAAGRPRRPTAPWPGTSLEETYETLEAIEAEAIPTICARSSATSCCRSTSTPRSPPRRAVRHRGRRRGLVEKMLRRNPHVFGDVEETDPPGSTSPGSRSRPRRSSAPACSTGSRAELPALSRAAKVLDRLGTRRESAAEPAQPARPRPGRPAARPRGRGARVRGRPRAGPA